jgi:hypothetical protein
MLSKGFSSALPGLQTCALSGGSFLTKGAALDLSFSRFEFDTPLTVLPADLAVMMVGIAARQAASPTARFQARLFNTPAVRSLFAPLHGAFNANMAASLIRWKER